MSPTITPKRKDFIVSNLILRDSQDSSKLNKPYKQRLETALDNIQATVFYPIKYLGPMLIAAFPATITGLSFYYHIIETVGYTWALTVAILAGLLFEIANLFLAHIASDLFNHKKIWQGIAIAILATITIYQIMQVLGESVLIVGQSLLPVVHITPLITAFVYIANTFAETIKDERQQAKIDYDFETQKRLIELENLRLDSEQKRTMKAEKLRLKHEETLAAIDRKPTGIQPEILDRKNVQNAGNNGKTEILAEINFDRKMKKSEILGQLPGLIGQGLTNTQIGEIVGRNERTIRDYRKELSHHNGTVK